MPKRDKIPYAAQARTAIRECFDQLAVFRYPLPIALYHYIAAAELDTLQSAADAAAGPAESHRRLVESSEIAIRALHDRCPIVVGGAPTMDRDAFLAARELYDFAHGLSQVEYSLALADRGQFEFFVSNKDPRITFAYTSLDADLSDTRTRALDIHHLQPRDAEYKLPALLDELRAIVPATYPERCAYSYTPRLIELTRTYGQQKLARTNPLEFPSTLEIDTVSFAQLQAFWAALLGIVDVHTAAHCIADQGDLQRLAIHTIVLGQPQDEFVNLIAAIADLSRATVEQLVHWFTYDPAIGDRCPILQPFLGTPPYLILPSAFVNGNRFERNFRKLLHTHPYLRRFASSFEVRLEPIALASLQCMFPDPPYYTAIQVDIPGLTDIDLLIIERTSGFVLVLQHK